MTITYTYSLSGDFGGATGLNVKQLHDEISGNTGISPNILAVSNRDNDVEIVFNSALSAGEQTTLDGIVSAHTPNTSKERRQFFIFTPKRDIITPKNNWVLSSYFQYPGSDQVGTIDYIDLIANMDLGVTSYDARIINKKTGEVIASKMGLTNTQAETHDLGAITNVPTTKSTLELQIQKNGGKSKEKVEIEQIIVYYGN